MGGIVGRVVGCRSPASLTAYYSSLWTATSHARGYELSVSHPQYLSLCSRNLLFTVSVQRYHARRPDIAATMVSSMSSLEPEMRIVSRSSQSACKIRLTAIRLRYISAILLGDQHVVRTLLYWCRDAVSFVPLLDQFHRHAVHSAVHHRVPKRQLLNIVLDRPSTTCHERRRIFGFHGRLAYQ